MYIHTNFLLLLFGVLVLRLGKFFLFCWQCFLCLRPGFLFLLLFLLFVNLVWFPGCLVPEFCAFNVFFVHFFYIAFSAWHSLLLVSNSVNEVDLRFCWLPRLSLSSFISVWVFFSGSISSFKSWAVFITSFCSLCFHRLREGFIRILFNVPVLCFSCVEFHRVSCGEGTEFWRGHIVLTFNVSIFVLVSGHL